jgi:hypothetical protein
MGSYTNGIKMKGIISTTKAELTTINEKINSYVKSRIKNYNAKEWGKITKSLDGQKYVLNIKDDERLGLNALTKDEKKTIIDINPDEFFIKLIP